jgi:hypothetical protein
MRNTGIRLAIFLFAGLLAAGLVVVYKQSQVRSLERRTIAGFDAVVTRAVTDPAKLSHVRALAVEAHAAAWAAAFTPQSLTGGTLNETAYDRGVMTSVLSKLRAEKDEATVKALERLSSELGLEGE